MKVREEANMRLDELINKVNNKSDEHKQRAYIEERIVSVVNVLIKKRVDLNMTQKELAIKLGMKQEAIARFESIKVIPKIDTIFKIAYGLDLDLKIADAVEFENVKESISTLNDKLDQISDKMNEIKYSIKRDTEFYCPQILGSTSTTLTC